MRKVLFVTGIILIVLLALVGIAAAGDPYYPEPVNWGASDDGVIPSLTSGNPTCNDIGCCCDEVAGAACTCGCMSVKFDDDFPNDGDAPLVNGASFGGVTLNFVPDGDEMGNTTVSWSATVPVHAVIVKGGPEAEVYYYYAYANGDTDDEGLLPPWNTNNGKPYGYSHVSFCTCKATAVPEFPIWFIPTLGFIGLVGTAVVITKRE